eukprot:3472997-Rhodomonas_salina.3
MKPSLVSRSFLKNRSLGNDFVTSGVEKGNKQARPQRVHLSMLAPRAMAPWRRCSGAMITS